ncbi:G-protein subunit alpha 8 [Piromyces finnis]|uniref:G-protein subunit alpha 8 n=1 Tax=Piromyces finnis TaxID=1754191 RepID=A0A1Y1VA58_9FUNG|nr:G-protein subunit alpha 8 [Piromyces finnis]|eukprot:ORX51047.1 G-protein subunit alpha 8 [Piromyces finnis]
MKCIPNIKRFSCGNCFKCSCSGIHLSKKNKVENEIGKKLELEGIKDKLKMKILLLGSGESGKSTVLKQLKMIHKIEMTQSEIQDYIQSLRRNALQCMNILIEQVQAYELEFTSDESKDKAALLQKLDDEESDESFTLDVADAINYLWKNESAIKEVWEKRSEFWILDAADYYFENVERFIQDDFEPTEEDFVMARIMTTGIIKTELNIKPLQFTVVDVGGQRNERRKWIHCFDDVNAIIFIANLSGYNTVLFEDQTQNRMMECLTLFSQIANNQAFLSTPIYLLFNKKDLFESKIRNESITVCEAFKDYDGPGDLNDCLNFVEKKFREQLKTQSDRLKVFHIAARFKRDIKTTWEDIVADIKVKNKKELESAIKELKARGELPQEIKL